MSFCCKFGFFSIPFALYVFTFQQRFSPFFLYRWGWSGGAMVLGKLPLPGRPTNLDYGRARAYCCFFAEGAGGGLFGHFSLVYHFSFLSPSLWETARYRLKYCLKGPLSPKTTNQILYHRSFVLYVCKLHIA